VARRESTDDNSGTPWWVEFLTAYLLWVGFYKWSPMKTNRRATKHHATDTRGVHKH
jgi:hypothetical protein